MNTHLARVRRRKSDQKRLLDHLAIQAGAFNVSNVAVAALRGEAPKAAAGRAGLAAGALRGMASSGGDEEPAPGAPAPAAVGRSPQRAP